MLAPLSVSDVFSLITQADSRVIMVRDLHVICHYDHGAGLNRGDLSYDHVLALAINITMHYFITHYRYRLQAEEKRAAGSRRSTNGDC